MRYVRESFNDGETVFENEFTEQFEQIEEVLSNATYQVKHTFQSGRENELIFDPVGMNRVLRERLRPYGWSTEVNLNDQGYQSGKDIDINKGEVAGEIQFGNFAYLDADMNRLQRLYDGRLELETGTEVNAGIVIVVRQDMPTSNSVSHFQQATTRAAPVALINEFECPNCGETVNKGMPALVYGIEPPEEGEEVMFNEYEAQRSRTLENQEEISFQEVYIGDSDEQSRLEELD
jgi:hypothetical protein